MGFIPAMQGWLKMGGSTYIIQSNGFKKKKIILSCQWMIKRHPLLMKTLKRINEYSQYEKNYVL